MGQESKPDVVIVTGPTASGKSGLALALARALDGVVINADSMQVYRELSILTARPDADALAAVPHRLYGVLSGRTACSAGQWRAMAVADIEDARSHGRLPLVVGGTGLYLRALEKGLARMPAIPAPVRAAARDRMAEIGGAAFHAALAERDPTMASRLHPSDRQRLIRAWEVLEATGRSLAAWQDSAHDGTPYRFAQVVLLPPREALYRACNGRFEAMVAAGALDEVRALLDLGLSPDLPVMKALGVRELAAHLRGGDSLAAAIAKAQQATRRYAKRQMTWLRTQGPARGEHLDQRQGTARGAASGGVKGTARGEDPDRTESADQGSAPDASAEPLICNKAAQIVIVQQDYKRNETEIFPKIRDFLLTL